MSSSGAGQNASAKKPKEKSATLSVDTDSVPNAPSPSIFLRGTNEIDWSDVAGSFHAVKLKGGTSPHAKAAPKKPAFFKNIISPFCRELTESPVASDSESDTEEDLSDEAVLARHQFVLDEMKEKLTAFMESRKRQQERKKNKQKNS